ncbi:MAG TPA: serine/threonine-protein kinase [Kofleriaceae bacterium]|jgi:serine/threonine-protein kinase
MSERRWGAASTAEEAREYLQTRLALFARLMIASFGALLVFLAGMYRAYPALQPARNAEIFGGAAVALAIMTTMWRGLLVRRTLSIAALYRVDIVFSLGIGVAFALSALGAPALRPAAYTTMLYGSYTVFMRAIVVPSSGPRTAVLSTLLFLPIAIAGVVLALTTTQELPPPAFILGGWTFAGIAILLATTGSRIIYGLRRQVSLAMQLGQYTLEDKIGEGGMGAVYRARHALLRRPTAVKLLLPERIGAEGLARFEREVQHTAQLTHPNTVAVYDYGRSPDGLFYYAMEYLAGIDLEQLVARYGAQPAGRVVHVLTQVCGALAEAHGAGLVHRDIKPANIILCERGGVADVAKVVDFGLVKAIAREPGAAAAELLGTPAYLAPEAVTDPARLGPPADLYALGAVGYFLLSGRRVFDGATPAEVCVQHVTAPPPPLDAAVPPALAAILMRLLAKSPADRYTARELAEALAQVPAFADESGWSRAAAADWWRSFSTTAAAHAATAAAPTRTLTIELPRPRH